MAEHVWSVLCRKAVIDRDGGQISLHEVIESMAAETFSKEDQKELEERRGPIKLPQEMYLVSWWVRSDYEIPEELTVRLVLENPGGEKGIMLGEYAKSGKPVPGDPATEMPLDLMKYKSFRRITRIRGFPWAGAGLYHFIIEGRSPGGKWKAAARIPLEVEIQPVPEDPTEDV